MAISNQIRKSKSESLLNYLSEHQFIPNANMPTGVVSFDFMDRDQSVKLHRLYDKSDKLQNQISAETDPAEKFNLQQELTRVRKEITELQRATTASRDIHTALNEYAPEQTVVVNEKTMFRLEFRYLVLIMKKHKHVEYIIVLIVDIQNICTI